MKAEKRGGGGGGVPLVVPRKKHDTRSLPHQMLVIKSSAISA